MEPGTRVRMSEALKKVFYGQCRPPGRHVGPLFDPGDGTPEDPGGECWSCSTRHVEEFGECTGTILGPAFPTIDAPEVDVRWEPSGLRYAYHPEMLDVVPT